MVGEIEAIQKRAIKLIRGSKGLSYEEKMRWLQLPILKYRHFRGDLLEIHKIFNNMYDVKTVPTLTLNLDKRTRENSFKLIVERSQYDLRKFSFYNRVIRAWNSLPDSVVVADSTKFLLRIFWTSIACENCIIMTVKLIYLIFNNV